MLQLFRLQTAKVQSEFWSLQAKYVLAGIGNFYTLSRGDFGQMDRYSGGRGGGGRYEEGSLFDYKDRRGRGSRRGRGGRKYGNKTRRPPLTPEQEEERAKERERQGGPPRGLRGRDIGMWYASRGRAKNKERERLERPEITIGRDKLRNLSRMVDSFKDDDAGYKPRLSHSARPRNVPSSSAGSSHDNQAANFGRDRPGSSRLDKNSFESSTWNDHGRFSGQSRNGSSESRSWREQEPAPSSSGAAAVSDLLDDEPLEGPENVAAIRQYLSERSDYDVSEIEMLEDDKLEELQRRVQQNTEEDKRYLREFEAKQSEPRYQKMQQFRKKLPSYDMAEDILKTVGANQVTVISGETGCGKTTQVAQFILDDFIKQGLGSLCRVVCTQPRRISAISVAQRVAQERADDCGGPDSSVGYQIRLEVKRPRPRGSILFCTTGIVLKWLESDPLLTHASHIILDEIHERDLHSDFLMIIMKEILPKRPDLKLILMSATLNAEQFSQYYGQCPMLNIPGFTFAVEELYLEDVVEMLKYQPPEQTNQPRKKRPRSQEDRQKIEEEKWNYDAWLRNLECSPRTQNALTRMDSDQIDLELIAELVRHIMTTKGDGAILIFLPGWEQISKLYKMLEGDRLFNSRNSILLPLHSLMPTVNQREVFDRPPQGVRKIVIATNIAETSITIDDVVYVIDCGKIKLKNYDAANNVATLQPEWNSLANSRQRRGRAGRVQPGVCYHLYTRYQHEKLEDYQLPEMLRTRLEELCLQIKLLKRGKIEPFVQKAMQPPPMESVLRSIELLHQLNALNLDEELTPLGHHLARMPVDPHTGKMILFGAMFGCLDPILTVAASLSFKDAFVIPMGKERMADLKKKELAQNTCSDHLMLVNAYNGWLAARAKGRDQAYCWDNFLSSSTLWMLTNMRKQFADLLFDLGFISTKSPTDADVNINAGNNKLLRAVLCAGLYPNVGKIPSQRKKGKVKRIWKIFTKNDGRVNIHPKSVNYEEPFPYKWLVYYLKMKTTKVYLYDATAISPYPLLFFGGDITIKNVDGDECVVVDDWIVFKASQKIASLVKDLRHELDKVLQDKVQRPGPTNWAKTSKEGQVMRAILDLLTTEDYGEIEDVQQGMDEQDADDEY
ncbi:ATP-dependent DNA/RNA helicase DHX36-like isoform X2 [Lineus longissimus]|uniref:ATP-dependent DNA/RNA helicase DHX36-like isoform X2 n=1 Tax=Lineus longissimus TaxID=88925 RepID=UPI00315CB52C